MELKEVTAVAKRTPCESFWKVRISVRFVGRESVHIEEELLPDNDFMSRFDLVMAEVTRRVKEAVQ